MAETAKVDLIPAYKNKLLFAFIERAYIGPALRRHFHSVALSVHPDARAALLQRDRKKRPPVIYASAHPSWWDGHLAWSVERALGRRDAYMMMDVISLRNYRFFSWAGAFSVDRDDPRSALASISYICDILNSSPDKALWIFPQGTITPPDRRPLHFYPGIAHIVRRLDQAIVVPIAWRLEHRLEQHPEAFCRVGPPQIYSRDKAVSSRDITRRLSDAIALADDEVRDTLAATDPKDMPPSYTPLLSGRQSTHRNWDAVLERARGLRGRLFGD